ncbi:hypothetical protein T07_4643 [Trichinella nelsoni]|uniref:Uncharacterized protein n=1 Tax=Trichinella nelsoni TaxID=6336 RepID=A0A0V0RVE0_9BILA|nr:hypothetical protein T07_4643 [Trichinella nelsoni]
MLMHRIHREVEEEDQQQVDVHILETGILEMEVKYTVRRGVGKVKGEADQDVEGDLVGSSFVDRSPKSRRSLRERRSRERSRFHVNRRRRLHFRNYSKDRSHKSRLSKGRSRRKATRNRYYTSRSQSYPRDEFEGFRLSKDYKRERREKAIIKRRLMNIIRKHSYSRNHGLYTLDSIPGNYCKNCSKVLQRLYEKKSHRQSITKPENLSPSNDQLQPLTQASSGGSSSQISLHTSDAKDERSPKFYTFTNSDDSDHKVKKKHHSKNRKKNRKHKKKETKSGHESFPSSHQHD